MDGLIGHTLGRYQIIQQLGQGGMAVVYKAHDPQLDREVAVKLIKREVFAHDQMNMILRRFDREAKMLAGLNHPNIVKVLDFEGGDMPYLVMEYFGGGSLKDFLEGRGGKPVPWQEAAQLLAPIARALESAHNNREKIIHRDVKPSNILMDMHGYPMLTDFGIAKFLESPDATTITTTGEIIGTPHYQAPEQWLGSQVDHRVDIYALGVVFFEMVTGQRPYHADTPMALMKKKINEPPLSPTKLVPGLPKEVEFILLKSLASLPQDRYADMGELAVLLENLAKGNLPKTASPHRKNPVLSKRLVQIVVISVAGSLFLLTAIRWAMVNTQIEDAPDPPTETLAPVEPLIIPTNTENIPPPTQTMVPTLEVLSPVTQDQAELAFVPAGEFLMGSDPDEPYFWGAETPKHVVYLDAFWVYQTEVTNRMYRLCVDDGQCSAPQENSSHTHENYFNNPDFDGYPVIHVTHEDARTYCEWAGARLLSEAEWEKAARGEEGFLFPWGNDELQNHLANFCDEGCPGHSLEYTEVGFNDGYREVAPVGSYPAGASPFGVLDMAGNVLEWVADWYAVDYYAHSPYANPTGPDNGTKHIIRGGSWWSLRDGLRPAARASKELTYSSDMVGFRCAVDVP